MLISYLNSLRYSSNNIINVCFNNAIDNAHSIIGGKLSYLRDKLNVNFYEVGLCESLKKIDVLFKITHRISIQIYNLKNLLSLHSENSTIDYLNIYEINFMICHIVQNNLSIQIEDLSQLIKLIVYSMRHTF